MKDDNLEGFYSFKGTDRYGPLCTEVAKFVRTATANEHVFIFEDRYYKFLSGQDRASADSIIFEFNFKSAKYDAPIPSVELSFFSQWFVVLDLDKVSQRVEGIALDRLNKEQRREAAVKYKAEPMRQAKLENLTTPNRRKKFTTKNDILRKKYSGLPILSKSL